MSFICGDTRDGERWSREGGLSPGRSNRSGAVGMLTRSSGRVKAVDVCQLERLTCRSFCVEIEMLG